MMEAAAIDALRVSPLMIVSAGLGRLGRQIIAVDKNMAWRHWKRHERPPHGQKIRLADIEAVDFRRGCKGDRHGERLPQDVLVKAFAVLGCKLLRIVESARQAARIENDGGGGDRPREGAASGFVDSRHRPNAAL